MSPSADRILNLLKRDGPLTADMLGEELGMTGMGARRHLDNLAAEELVETFDRVEGVGRPKKFWLLTQKGHDRFPDTHDELVAQMIGDVRRVFGEAGLERLIAEREVQMRKSYGDATKDAASLRDKLEVLADLRTREGYMARVEALDEPGEYLLIEDHCPICAAARSCQNFCRSEFDIFRAVLGPSAEIERMEYLFEGGRRCAYRISEKP